MENLISIIVLSVCLLHSGARCSADNVYIEGRHSTKLYQNNLQQMIRITNADIEPCDDFYSHVCGNYGKTDQTESDITTDDEESVPPPFLYNKQDRMHFFLEHHSNFGTTPGSIVAQLYDECKERDRRHVHSTKNAGQPQWQRMLQEIKFLALDTELYKGWPYLRYQWQQLNREYDMNWVTLAAEFATHGIASWLHIYFAKETIFVAPVENLHCPSLTQFQRNLKPILQRRNEQIARVIAHELYDFCRSLSGEQPLSAEDTTANGTSSILIDNNIAEYFQHFFGLLNFTDVEMDTARKIPIDVERISEMLQVLRQTEPRIIFNYIIWHALESLKFDDCYLLTEEFERLLLAEYWHWDVFTPFFSRDVGMATFLYQTTRFQKHRKDILMGRDWYKFLLAPLERKDFNIERLIQSYANSHLNVQNLTYSFSELTLVPGAFYANLLNVRRIKLRNSFMQTVIDDEDINHPAYFLQQFLEFCILLLKQPLFHYFSTQGFDMWQISNLLEDTDGYYTALDCLERQSLLHIEDDTRIYRVLSAEEVAGIFRFYRAFMETYRDYRFWLDGESFAFAEDFILQYFEMDSKRILFYSVAQLYCNRNDALYATQINRSFMNVLQFHEAFNCSTDAPMNPIVKCMITDCS